MALAGALCGELCVTIFNVIGHINEITLRRAGIILRWVTVQGYTILVFNQATQANSAWLSFHG